MAKKNREASTYDPSADLKQFESWKADLEKYWPEMDKWQEMYEFYKSKEERTGGAEVSLNTPFSIVESQIAKENEATLRITVKAKPDDSAGDFEEWVEAVIHDAIEDPDVARFHGTFRKQREMWSRQLKVSGNSVAEVNYCYKTQETNGKKKVVADNPYIRTRSYKSVIFNPAMQFSNSDVYYVEDYVTLEDLKSNEYRESKDGTGKGLYKNLGDLKMALDKKEGFSSDSSSEQFVSGDTKIDRKRKPVRVITKWKGLDMKVTAYVSSGKGVVIREATDPFKIGGHNLLLGMRYQIEGRPYAYGEIAAIYKPVRAQDTIVSQSIEIVNRYLRGSYVLGSDMDIDQFMLVIANGGAIYGDPNSIANVPVSPPPGQAFQQIDVLQQAIERAARFSLYGAGLASQATDKTQGTASGIQSIQAAAEPNVQIQLDDIQEMLMRPAANAFLKMIANLMGDDEIRYGLLKGEKKGWVQATKAILIGEATMADMVTAGLISEEDARSYMVAVDPATGQEVPIPGADKALVFDVDWVVDAKLDNQSAADKEKRNMAEMQHVQWGMSVGVKIDPEKAWEKMGKKFGFDDLEELLFTPEELQRQQQQAAQQQEQQMQAEQQAQQAQAQQEMASKEADMQGKMQIEAMKAQLKPAGVV